MSIRPALSSADPSSPSSAANFHDAILEARWQKVAAKIKDLESNLHTQINQLDNSLFPKPAQSKAIMKDRVSERIDSLNSLTVEKSAEQLFQALRKTQDDLEAYSSGHKCQYSGLEERFQGIKEELTQISAPLPTRKEVVQNSETIKQRLEKMLDGENQYHIKASEGFGKLVSPAIASFCDRIKTTANMEAEKRKAIEELNTLATSKKFGQRISKIYKHSILNELKQEIEKVGTLVVLSKEKIERNEVLTRLITQINTTLVAIDEEMKSKNPGLVKICKMAKDSLTQATSAPTREAVFQKLEEAEGLLDTAQQMSNDMNFLAPAGINIWTLSDLRNLIHKF